MKTKSIIKPIISIVNHVMCCLGYHKWKNIDDYLPIPKNGEMICFQNIHECERCKKQKYLGMGCIV